MDAELRAKVEVAHKVRGFLEAHLEMEPAFRDAMLRIEDILNRAEGLRARHDGNRSVASGARAHRRELRRVIHSHHLRFLVAVGAGAFREDDEKAVLFRLPRGNAPDDVFLLAATHLLEAAEKFREPLLASGMAPTLPEALAARIAEMRAAMETAGQARLAHIGARAGFSAIVGDLAAQIRIIDGITRYRFGDDAGVMSRWEAVRRLSRHRSAPAA